MGRIFFYQIKHEEKKQMRLHDNPIIETVLVGDVMKECSDDKKLPGYIQYVAMRPFITHMYTAQSMALLRDIKVLYLDATGSLIQSLKHYGINQSVLYYSMTAKMAGLPQFPVAEMLSSDQSAATLNNFLTLMKRDYNRSTGHILSGIEVETDMSFAMIHGVLGEFHLSSQYGDIFKTN